MADTSWQFENDKQQILPPAYSQGSYDANPPIQTQTVIHINNAVPAPPDYFVFSLLVTIFCCLPFGIVGLVKSSEVRTRAAMGDSDGALQSSLSAKKWAYAGLITGLAIFGAVILFYVLLFVIVYSY
ncbi:Interferon-induced transmembrane protein 3 [Holothuria leucospilota]|uniref:Interferon-induced transmembrane protein 3 n=1 Tax=Holothuria leucospilota TaxID=206669 RepID=A0A9Q1HLE0_HOLLE|nr:Interferon-induced transmembrane protein 3 [Holothuria leucospilota]